MVSLSGVTQLQVAVYEVIWNTTENSALCIYRVNVKSIIRDRRNKTEYIFK